MFPRGLAEAVDHSAHNIFVGQLAALVATTVEHVIAPDVRYLDISPLTSGYVVRLALLYSML